MEQLFAEGRSLVKYPVKIIYLETREELLYPAQAMFVVPKRSFKKAHDRNLLKRRMREIYRLNKSIFYEQVGGSGKKFSIALLYTAKKEENYQVIESAMLRLLGNLTREK